MVVELHINEVREFLKIRQGREVDLNYIRKEMGILPDTKAWSSLGKMMSVDLTKEKIVRPSGKKDGVYRVVEQVEPVRVFMPGRERRPPVELIFPKDFNTGKEMDFAEDVIIREGDLILISGMSNFGKTTLCLNFCGENIDKNPVLMGNEYTSLVESEYVPSPRFFNRLEAMDWVEWVNKEGNDKFTLLPVRNDYAEHIVKDKINIIDWINIEGEYYMISPVTEAIKKQLGKGVGIIALQKNEGNTAGRGGAPTRDFADLELLVDKFGKSDVLLTIGKVKEYKNPIIGKTYVYSIVDQGVKIVGFREVKKCPVCWGKGYKGDKECPTCLGKKFIDK